MSKELFGISLLMLQLVGLILVWSIMSAKEGWFLMCQYQPETMSHRFLFLSLKIIFINYVFINFNKHIEGTLITCWWHIFHVVNTFSQNLTNRNDDSRRTSQWDLTERKVSFKEPKLNTILNFGVKSSSKTLYHRMRKTSNH